MGSPIPRPPKNPFPFPHVPGRKAGFVYVRSREVESRVVGLRGSLPYSTIHYPSPITDNPATPGSDGQRTVMTRLDRPPARSAAPRVPSRISREIDLGAAASFYHGNTTGASRPSRCPLPATISGVAVPERAPAAPSFPFLLRGDPPPVLGRAVRGATTLAARSFCAISAIRSTSSCTACGAARRSQLRRPWPGMRLGNVTAIPGAPG